MNGNPGDEHYREDEESHAGDYWHEHQPANHEQGRYGDLEQSAPGTYEPYPYVARPVEVGIARPAGLSDPLKLRQLTRGQAARNLLVFALVLFAFMVTAGQIAVAIVGPKRLEEDVHVLLYATVAAGWLTLLAVVALAPMLGFRLRQIGLAWNRKLLDPCLGLVVTACSFLTFFMVAGLLSALWPAAFRELEHNPEEIMKMIPDWNPVELFALMCTVAVYEELLFRGVLLTHLRRLTGSWTIAVPLSAALFAAMHSTQVAAAAIPLFVVAIVWSIFVIWRRSLVPTVIGHALFNFIQIMFLIHLPLAPTSQPAGSATVLGVLGAVAGLRIPW